MRWTTDPTITTGRLADRMRRTSGSSLPTGGVGAEHYVRRGTALLLALAA
jgi:hypothetical protein